MGCSILTAASLRAIGIILNTLTQRVLGDDDTSRIILARHTLDYYKPRLPQDESATP